MITAVIPTDIPTSMTTHEGQKLADLATNQTVLELGAWQGYSTVCLAQTAAIVHSVDWHGGDQHAGPGSTLVPFLRNLQRYGLLAHVNVHVGRFDEILPVLKDGSFDLVFVDGQHDYESVRHDLHQARRLAREGGTVAFHDYGVAASSEGGGEFGVTRAVDEWFRVDELVDTLAIVHV